MRVNADSGEIRPWSRSKVATCSEQSGRLVGAEATPGLVITLAYPFLRFNSLVSFL